MTIHSEVQTPRRRRNGMTLIEVMLSVVILSGALLGMGAFTTNFARSVKAAELRSVADQLAIDRLEQVKASGRYARIDTLFAGKIETNAQGHAGFTRKTNVRHVGGSAGALYDYRIVTVEVTTAALVKPVRKTTIISVH